ncbi:MAG: DUF4214 domain-containing protein [Pirellulales bacterium]|nr:DUF4214 domain-containing protein [Pirellulales bacterium]
MSFSSPWYRRPTASRRRGSRAASQRARKADLRFETLEHRRMLVVGAQGAADLVAPGAGFDGVVALDFTNASTNTTLNANFTGALLYDGRHILATAQAFDRDGDGAIDDDLGSFQVVFEMNKQHYAISVDATSANIVLAPDWDGDLTNGADLAIVTLPVIAPFPAERYNIFRVPADDENQSPEDGSVLTIVGYGDTGTGVTGSLPNSKGIKRIGNNRVTQIDDQSNGDLLHVEFEESGGNSLGTSEAVAAFGDKGAPAFLSKLPDGSTLSGGPVIAGIYSFEEFGDPLDEINQFGIAEHYTRVSGFTSFVDDTLDDPADITLDMNFQPLGNDGTPDEIIARRDPNDSTRLQLLVDGEVVWSDLLSHVNKLIINGSGDDDNIIIVGDFNKDIALNGRTGFDSFEYIGDGLDGAVYTPDGTSPGAGTLVVGIDTIDFSNFEPMTVSALASYTLTTPNSRDNILVQSGPQVGQMTISGTSGGLPFESVTFFDIPTFTIDTATNDGGSPNDIITLNAPIPAQGLTTFVIEAGAGTDRVVYNGTDNNDTFDVNANGSIELSNPSHTFVTISSTSTGIEEVVLDGLDGDDTFNVNQNNPYSGGLFLAGGDPSASDVVNLIAPATFAQSVAITPLAADQTKQQITGFRNVAGSTNPIQTSGIELINYVGNDDPINDALNVHLGSGDNTARVERSTNDFDQITSDSLPRIAFQKLTSFTVSADTGSDVVTFKTANLAGATKTNYQYDAFNAGALAIEGADGNTASADDSYLVTHPTGNELAVKDNVSNVVVTATSASTRQLQINTLGGDDQVTVDIGTAVPSDYISVPILYDGGTGRDQLTVQGAVTPVIGTIRNVTYTPGPAVNQGRLSYDALTIAGTSRLMTIDFLNLEPVVDTSTEDGLAVSGTNSPNTINYEQGSTPTRGIVRVDEFESLEFENKAVLVMVGLGGDDKFVLDNASVPTGLTRIVADGGLGNDSITALNLPAVGAYLGTTLIGGAGDDVLDAGGVTQNSPVLLQGNDGNDTLTGGAGTDTLEGGAGDDVLVSSRTSDTFNGGTGFDQLVIRGTKGNDNFDVLQNTPSAVAGDNYTISSVLATVNNSQVVVTTNSTFQIVPVNGAAPNSTANRPTVEELFIDAGDGNDTMRVAYADEYSDTALTAPHAEITTNGIHNQMLRFTVDGGAPDASDRLIVRDIGTGDLVLVRQASTPGSGRVTMAPAINNGITAQGDVVYTHIERVDVTPANSITGGTGADGKGRIVVFQADPFEMNDNRLIPTEFSDLATTNLNPTIDPGEDTNTFGLPQEPGDEDWYVFQPTKTSVYRLDLVFNQIAQVNSGRAGLPGDGNLDISVYDINGKQITTGTDVSGQGLVDLGEQNIGEQLTFGAQAGNHYYIRVKGHPHVVNEEQTVNDAINTYQIKLTDVDVIGPQVTKLYISDNPNTPANETQFDLQATKSFPGTTPGPTPLVNGLSLDIKDLPGRALDFTYPALIGGTVTEVEQNNSIADGQNIDQYFNLNASPNIGDTAGIDTSLTVPHATILGTGDGSFDFYTFTVGSASAGSPVKGTFDIDFTTGGADTFIQLFDEAGNLLSQNDDSALINGAGGSATTNDSFLTFNFTAPGKYAIKIGAFNAGGASPIPLQNGENYTLQVSLEEHPILLNPGLVQVKGDANGLIPIKEVRFIPISQVAGLAATGTLQIDFFSPLPDDRYTLTLSDHVTDPANNPLDGESNAAEPQPAGPPSPFPSGNGTPGGDFTARFTVDSRPEIATYAGLNVATDLNGNSTFDPTNTNFTNRDTIFQFGTVNDQRFAGKFGDASSMGLRFDMLSAYGRDPVNGRYRFLIDWNFNGAVDPGDYIDSPLQIDGLAVAGNFTGAANSKDEVGIFDGTKWYLDVLGAPIVVTNGQRGYPIVGDFDGDGKDDLATYQNDTFYIDFAANGFNGTDQTIGFGAPGVLDRPLAADMDGDGIDDLGIWIPQSGSVTGDSEWRFLISDDLHHTKRITGSAVTLAHQYSPTPLGHDIHAQFGNLPALPLVGNFDPPVIASASTSTGDTKPSTDTSTTTTTTTSAPAAATLSANSVFVSAVYNSELKRDADADGLAYWTKLLDNGASRQQVVQSIQQSTEYRANLIDHVYETYLGRAADAGGRQWWLDQFAHGATQRQLTASIIGSDEYFKNAGGSDFNFVKDLYQDVLGREVDFPGASWWTTQLANGAKRSAVASSVLGSDEALKAEALELYQDVLGRSADAGGLNYWIANMRGDGREEAARVNFIASDELYKLMAAHLATTNANDANVVAKDFIQTSGKLKGGI